MASSITYSQLQNSLFLDYTSYGTTTFNSTTLVQDAYHLSSHSVGAATETVNVALILPRANDPTALLGGNWAARQTTLAELNENDSLWSTYGASESDYQAAVDFLTGQEEGQLGLSMIGDSTGADGYVSSAESRTIWLQLNPTDFQTLFDVSPLQDGDLIDGGLYFWNGYLSLPTDLNVEGIWLDFEVYGPDPAASDLSGGASVTPQPGPQSIGNSLGLNHSSFYAGQIADWYYNFPLASIDTPTTTIGLIEPGIGDALPTGSASFQQLFDEFRQHAGISTPGSYYVVDNNGEDYDQSDPGERSLDVGVASSASPGSTIGLYAGSGFQSGAGSTAAAYSNTFTSFQSAFFDYVNNPGVISASFGMKPQVAPGSPFASAVQELFIDAALRNLTVLQANNDFGSSWGFANGLANQSVTMSSPYVVMVGGTSLTNLAAAPLDPTIASDPTPSTSVYGLALAGDPGALWALVEGGLIALPAAVSGADAWETTLLEAVWNDYAISGSTWSGGGVGAGDGSVDTTQQTPSYQLAFGLMPTSANPSGGTGRGAPDVAANAGGNLFYKFPGEAMDQAGSGEGTSAAAPLWAALMAQIDAIFDDQGLPNLGYANDLLYTAAAIAPAAFNDITFGNNVASYYRSSSGVFVDSTGATVNLTGYGYDAAPGYDLTSGLGSPNGTLLARALTWVAHSQLYFADEPDVFDLNGNGGWESGADQSLLLQATSASAVNVAVHEGSGTSGFSSSASGPYAWTSRLAQQSLQPDFDPNLVRLFDMYAQGTVSQSTLGAGESFSISINGSQGQTPQATLTNSFGFADFVTSDGAVRVARPVAVAETAGGADDQVAVVLLRQNGVDNLTLTFYRVDDLSGSIDGLAPGASGYAAAVQSRSYQLTTGGTSINSPGYGNFAQSALANVDAGDLIAMTLTNNISGDTFWAFAQANETVGGRHVGHLWNYGINTWGWEDMSGGGDFDYNDLIVGLDFTSASGQGWLA